MIILNKIEQAISSLLSYEGYKIVVVRMLCPQTKKIQIMIEKTDDTPITIDDCVKVSRIASLQIEVEKIIKDKYILEVSSPGLDRPLFKAEDYKRFVGKKVLVKTQNAICKRKSFNGMLQNADDDCIILDLDPPLDSGEKNVKIFYQDIKSANLSLDF